MLDHREKVSIKQMLPEGELFEMVLTTLNGGGNVNSAPVGVTRRNDRIIISLAKTTKSLCNLMKIQIGILNLVNDPLIFAESAFNLCGSDSYTSDDPAPRLKNARVTIVIRLETTEDFVKRDRLGKTKFARLVFNIERVKIHKSPMPHSRKYSAAIEAVVAVTKARVALDRNLTDFIDETIEHVQKLRTTAGDLDGRANAAFELCVKQLESMTRSDKRG